MKNLKTVLGVGILAVASFFAIAADHIDAPAVQGGTSDITDFYAFQGEDTNNLVFVANLQGLLSPSSTGDATFSENVLVEINIDNSGDNVEDLVIQAIARDGKTAYIPFWEGMPSREVDSDVLFEMFRENNKLTSQHIVYYYDNTALSGNTFIMFIGVGSVGQCLDYHRLWVLISEATGIVDDYVYREAGC